MYQNTDKKECKNGKCELIFNLISCYSFALFTFGPKYSISSIMWFDLVLSVKHFLNPECSGP